VTERRPGRPRSAGTDTAILEAARDLLVSDGYDRMTIEAIAARAGVTRPTVYRRWPSKAAIVADAVIAGHVATATRPPADTGDLETDLRAWLDQEFDRLADHAHLAVVRGLAAAATDAGVDARRLYDRFTGPNRALVTARLAAGVELGQARADLDVEAAVDAVLGTLLYRSLVPDPVSGSAAGFIDLLLKGMQPE